MMKRFVSGIALLAATAGCSARGGEAIERQQQGLIYDGTDDRIAVTDADFAANPTWRAIGWLGGCSGTLVAPNTVLTAAHCMLKTTAQNGLTFRPAFSGPPTPANWDVHPSATSTSFFRATADDAAYLPGADWAIIHLDPSSYLRGSTSFPATLGAYPNIPVGMPTFPAAEANITASVLGYSWDFLAANNAPHRHTGNLVMDAQCSIDANQKQFVGVFLSNIERNGGASGGPIMKNLTSSPSILATVGGGGEGSTSSFNQANANREVSAAGIAFAPFDAGGLAFANESGGQRWTFASDLTWINGLRYTLGQDPNLRHRPRSNWQDFRDGGTSPFANVYKRMTAMTEQSGALSIFAADATGIVWNKRRDGGVWANWVKWFPTVSSGQNALDISATSGGVTMMLYVLHSNCSVEARRKIGDSELGSLWAQPQSLGTPPGTCNGIASTNVGDLQHVFVTSSTSITTKSMAADGTFPAAWSDFSTGLPAGLTYVDVAAGKEPGGKMMVVLLVRDASNTLIYSRTRSGTEANSPWGNWTLEFNSVSTDTIELANATQIAFAPPNGQSTNAQQSIFFITKGGGVFTPAYATGGQFAFMQPYYAPFTPEPAPLPGYPECRAPFTGTRVPTAGSPSGFVRGDAVSTVVYAHGGHIKELSLGASWVKNDLTSLTSAPNTVSSPASFVRADGVTSNVFTAIDGSVRELALVGGNWSSYTLTSSGATGNPSAYVRSDSVSAVVYRDSSNHISELSLPLGSGTWTKSDLTALAGAASAQSQPTAYVRRDKVNAVVYRVANDHLIELSLALGSGTWQAFDLTAIAPGAVNAVGNPRAFTRSDGVSTVVYRSSDNHVRVLELVGSTWRARDVSGTSTGAAADPVGYVRADGFNAIVYPSSSQHVMEVTLSSSDTWSAPSDLNVLSGVHNTVLTSGMVVPYLRGDKQSIVLARTSDSNVHQFNLALNGSNWGHSNLTAIAGGTP